MKTPIPPRPARSSRPVKAQLPEFESLDMAHRAALQMLESFKQMVALLQDQGLDADARRRAREILEFFNGPGRHHHEEEEAQVFPGLLASTDVQLVAHVRRLQQDHGWLEQDWYELQPEVLAVAEGYNGYDLPMLVASLPVFDTLYRDHIALEETVVYPAAKRQKLTLLHSQGGLPRIQ
jgi:hemerythrin-like domain-containing protein